MAPVVGRSTFTRSCGRVVTCADVAAVARWPSNYVCAMVDEAVKSRERAALMDSPAVIATPIEAC